MKVSPMRVMILLVTATALNTAAIAEDVCIRIFCDSKKTDKITNEKRHGRFFTAELMTDSLKKEFNKEFYTIAKSDYEKAKEACPMLAVRSVTSVMTSLLDEIEYPIAFKSETQTSSGFLSSALPIFFLENINEKG